MIQREMTVDNVVRGQSDDIVAFIHGKQLPANIRALKDMLRDT